MLRARRKLLKADCYLWARWRTGYETKVWGRVAQLPCWRKRQSWLKLEVLRALCGLTSACGLGAFKCAHAASYGARAPQLALAAAREAVVSLGYPQVTTSQFWAAVSSGAFEVASSVGVCENDRAPRALRGCVFAGLTRVAGMAIEHGSIQTRRALTKTAVCLMGRASAPNALIRQLGRCVAWPVVFASSCDGFKWLALAPRGERVGATGWLRASARFIELAVIAPAAAGGWRRVA